MNKECQEFLNLRTKPGMSGIREASWILGVPEDWVSTLVHGRLLPTAGGHEPNCQFYFSTATLLRLAEDPEFYDKAISLMRRIFRRKNDSEPAKSRREGSERNKEARL